MVVKPVRLPCYMFLRTWRCTTLSNVRIILILRGSLSNDDGDVNENGTKAIGWDWQNNNFARTSSLFFVHLLVVTARLRCENALISRFVGDVNRRQRTTSFFFSWTSIHFFGTQLQRKCQHLTNWTRWNKRDEVWSGATSLFRCRFRCRRSRSRYC